MVLVIEIGFLLLGFAGSLIVIYGLAEDDSPRQPMRAFIPVGDGRPDSLCRVHVAAVPTHGNARHPDERLSEEMWECAGRTLLSDAFEVDFCGYAVFLLLPPGY